MQSLLENTVYRTQLRNMENLKNDIKWSYEKGDMDISKVFRFQWTKQTGHKITTQEEHSIHYEDSSVATNLFWGV